MSVEPPTVEPLRPCVVQYLYVHQPGESFFYPSSRSHGGAEHLAARYLECVLVQAASMRWNGPECDLLLVSNLPRRGGLTRHGQRLLDQILALEVELVGAEYRHAPSPEVTTFYSSRYVLDAIEAVAQGVEPIRPLWMVDVDCVWVDPRAVLSRAGQTAGIGCVEIGYPPDWDVSGHTRMGLGALGSRLGECAAEPPWIGGELLSASAAELGALVGACEQLEQELARLDVSLPTEEQLLTLAGGLGRVSFRDDSAVAGRIWTGPRHGAANPPDPGSLALWHLPSEKGLSFRRAARRLLRGRTRGLRRDLSSAQGALKRFNVAGAGRRRHLLDDAWILGTRVRDALLPGR
jgi:hypothetical protein